MNVKFRLTDIRITDEEKKYIIEKFENLAKKAPRIDNEATVIEIEIERNLDKQVKEDIIKIIIKMSVPHHEMIRSWSNGFDIISVFDKAKTKIRTQVMKYQEESKR